LNKDICELYDEIIESACSTKGKLFSKFAIKSEKTIQNIPSLTIAQRRRIKGGGCCVIS
jgi:hypothetical protein